MIAHGYYKPARSAGNLRCGSPTEDRNHGRHPPPLPNRALRALNNKEAAKLLAKERNCIAAPSKDVDIPAGLGQVIMPDGTKAPVTRARLVPNEITGGYTTAFPIVR